jgi:nitrite reductase (NO-forming)
MAQMDQEVHQVQSTGRIKSAVRIIFGVIWAVDAWLKWQPAFRKEYLTLLTAAAKGQSAILLPWFHFWTALVAPRVAFFAVTTALIESVIAIALIVGFARKITYILAALFSLLIWSTAEGFGGPYTAGATDVGTGIIYAVVFLALLALNAQAGPSRYSLDRFLEARLPWWHCVAEVKTIR